MPYFGLGFRHSVCFEGRAGTPRFEVEKLSVMFRTCPELKLSCILQPFFFVGFNPRNDRLKKKRFERHTEILASTKKGVVIRSA